MPPTPVVSVVMAARNARQFIRQAAESVLRQSLQDIELVVVDDASEDETTQVLEQLGDHRLRLWRSPRQLGIAAALNVGLDLARGRFIARMDADDISLPFRLEKQVAFLAEHPRVGLVGSAAEVIDVNGKSTAHLRVPLTDLEIRWCLHLANPFVHPSVMFVSSMLRLNSLRYAPEYEAAQDLEFWTRVLRHCEGANLPDALIQYRQHPGGLSLVRRAVQEESSLRACAALVHSEYPGLAMTTDDLRVLRTLFIRRVAPPPGVDLLRPYWAMRCVLLLRSFLRRLPASSARRDLARGVLLTVIAVTLGRPRQRGWWRVLLAAALVSPSSVGHTIRQAALSAQRRFVRSVLGRWGKGS